MSTFKIELDSFVPNAQRQYVHHERFIVGYYSGSAFVRRGVMYDNLAQAKVKMIELQEMGFDAHVVKIESTLFFYL